MPKARNGAANWPQVFPAGGWKMLISIGVQVTVVSWITLEKSPLLRLVILLCEYTWERNILDYPSERACVMNEMPEVG